MARRRDILTAAAAAAILPAIARAQSTDVIVERFPVWPGRPPGGDSLAVADAFVRRSPNGSPDDIAWPHVAVPMLTRVAPARPNGAALLMMPGGGYTRVAIGRGGSGIARHFAAAGITVFELLYRLPRDGWAAGADAPLQDAQRAMRMIRARADDWGIDPRRVGTIGFSAGGHLAARLAARSALATYAPGDAADRLDARPVVAGLFFPVVTMVAPTRHGGSYRELLGPAPDAARARAASAEIDLPPTMPPTFVSANADDPVVPVDNSLLMYAALRQAKVPAELMLFERGGHGLPLTRADGTPHPWSGLFLDFARRHGL